MGARAVEYETDRRARLSRAQSAPRARASARAMTDVPVIDLVSSPSEEDARVVDADARTRGDAGRQRAGAGGTGRKKRRVADVVLVDERGGTGRSRDERAGTRARASAAVGGGWDVRGVPGGVAAADGDAVRARLLRAVPDGGDAARVDVSDVSEEGDEGVVRAGVSVRGDGAWGGWVRMTAARGWCSVHYFQSCVRVFVRSFVRSFERSSSDAGLEAS